MKVKADRVSVIEHFNIRSSKDNRKRVNKISASFETPNGIVYNRAFEFPVDFTYDKMLKNTPIAIDVDNNL